MLALQEHQGEVWIRHYFVASCVLPAAIYWRLQTQKTEAEESACEVFKHDVQVQEVRRLLPPRMSKVRALATLNRKQKDELEENGLDHSVVRSDMVRVIYNGFRALGCRWGLWGGNA